MAVRTAGICIVAMVIATAGTADAATASGITCAAITGIITGRTFAAIRLRYPIAQATVEWRHRERPRPAARPVLPSLKCYNPQPSPISTAIRIRSE